MTRLDPAARVARALRALAGMGVVLVLAIAASGCVGGGAAPAPTPDPFAGLSDRSDQAFRDGLEAYGAGQYRDALTAFERARLLSPNADPRIDQMLERSRTALAPTATPVPPTPTSVPAPPTPTPVAMSTLTPDTELGRRYFGQVTLAMVPTREMDSPAATQFFFQDQIGLRIEGLKQHLRLPFSMRVFNMDTAQMVAEVQSEDSPSGLASTLATKTTADGSAAPVDLAQRAKNAAAAAAAGASASAATATAGTATTSSATAPSAMPVADEVKLTRFWDTYVWYHKGGEQPGRYRVELYASGLLTHTFEYTISTVPLPTPEPTLVPTLEPTATPPSVPAEPLAPPAPVVDRPRTAPAVVAAPVAPTATPQPTAIPSPTPMPTPSTAGSTLIGGLPAGLDVNSNDGRVFIADGSGVLWTTDPARPSVFNRPITLGNLPVDLAVDQTTGYVFVSARNESAVLVLDGSGRRLTSIPMPVAPGDLVVDSDLGLVYVALPERQALGVIDGRAGRLLRTVNSVPQITSLALDPARHTVYASHLAGQVSVVDVASSQVIARITATGVGLQSVATSRGLVYAINTATHELAVIEPVSQGVVRYPLAAEPAAVAASEDSGSVYVLTSRPNAIMRIDPTDGTEVGEVSLPDRSGRFGMKVSDQADFQGLRARIVLNRADESLVVTMPEAGSLSVVAADLFPPLNRDIPWVQAPEAPVFAYTIPGVMRPGAPPLPDQPSPYVQAAQANPASTTDEETN